MTSTDIVDRLDRWIAHLGEPTGAGRSDPDNDIVFLLRDARAEIQRLNGVVDPMGTETDPHHGGKIGSIGSLS